MSFRETYILKKPLRFRKQNKNYYYYLYEAVNHTEFYDINCQTVNTVRSSYHPVCLKACDYTYCVIILDYYVLFLFCYE